MDRNIAQQHGPAVLRLEPFPRMGGNPWNTEETGGTNAHAHRHKPGRSRQRSGRGGAYRFSMFQNTIRGDWSTPCKFARRAKGWSNWPSTR
jgi:hypothetical protein